MGGFFAAIMKAVAPALKWVGVNVIVPWITNVVTNLYQKFKLKQEQRREHAEQAARTQQGNANYEANPSDDTFGDSP